MPNKRKTITISSCPSCSEVHSYNLSIESSIIMIWAPVPSESRRKVYHRMFTCPKTNQQFQATISLQEEPDERIDSVDVEK